MRKFLLRIMMTAMAVILLAACGGNNNGEAEANEDNNAEESNEDALKVVTSFTIIADLAREIGAEDVDIHNLVPTGTDPHEYEPLPEDIKAATDADVLFYNGLNLEGGSEGWFLKMVDAVNQPDEHVYSLTERVEPRYLSGEDGKKEEMNPHAFIDPGVGHKMAEDMRDAFIDMDPDNADAYDQRAEDYLARVDEIDKEYEEKIGDIPEEDRTIVTSERAYQYMADHYGLNELFIWEVDTEENGSPEQIKSLVTNIKEHEVPVLFVESNVDTRPMETVSNETGVDIFDKPIYSDEIGEPGQEVDTYMKYLKYNIAVLHAGLTGEETVDTTDIYGEEDELDAEDPDDANNSNSADNLENADNTSNEDAVNSNANNDDPVNENVNNDDETNVNTTNDDVNNDNTNNDAANNDNASNNNTSNDNATNDEEQ